MTGGSDKIGLPALLQQLFQDARDVVRAEVQLVKSRAAARFRAARTGLILIGAAALLALAAVTGLMLGLVLALLPLVGALGAAGLVFIGGLIVAGLLGWGGAKMIAGPPDSASED